MLQRIQTMFLCMIVCSIFAFLFLPIWNKIDPNTTHGYILYPWKLQDIHTTEHLSNTWLMPYALLGSLSIVIILIAIYAIIRFDNRMLQLKLGALNSLLLTALLGTIVYLVTKNQSALLPEISGQYRIGFLMPIIAVVSNFLANYFIRKDEKLVNSTNRIR
ncbi:MAG: hypothetical protein BGO68_02855 [Candidatus Amoebophilus sp. 36-38]|nr:MAG: hypothetical protein BGO68_02855 [Candidatus Amoebophilus sp. 36-38]